MEEETEDGEKQEFLLDLDEIPRPAIRDTFVFRLPRWAYRRILGKKDLEGLDEAIGVSDDVDANEQDIDADTEVTKSTSAKGSTATAATRKRGKRGQKK